MMFRLCSKHEGLALMDGTGWKPGTAARATHAARQLLTMKKSRTYYVSKGRWSTGATAECQGVSGAVIHC